MIFNQKATIFASITGKKKLLSFGVSTKNSVIPVSSHDQVLCSSILLTTLLFLIVKKYIISGNAYFPRGRKLRIKILDNFFAL